MKKVLLTILIIVVLLISIGGGLIYWYIRNLNKNNPTDNSVNVETTQDDENGIKITINPGLKYDEIAKVIDNGLGTNSKKKFSIDEFKQIVENPVLDNFSSDVNSFLSQNKPSGKSLEGYLFPETYYFKEDATAMDVVNKLVNTLSLELISDDYQVIYESNHSYYQYLTIASLVEKETKKDEDKLVVADIIFRRKENGITTPSPVCNPGLASLRAVIYPEINEYNYFNYGSDNVIHYAKTLSEYQANVKKYK